MPAQDPTTMDNAAPLAAPEEAAAAPKEMTMTQEQQQMQQQPMQFGLGFTPGLQTQYGEIGQFSVSADTGLAPLTTEQTGFGLQMPQPTIGLGTQFQPMFTTPAAFGMAAGAEGADNTTMAAGGYTSGFGAMDGQPQYNFFAPLQEAAAQNAMASAFVTSPIGETTEKAEEEKPAEGDEDNMPAATPVMAVTIDQAESAEKPINEAAAAGTEHKDGVATGSTTGTPESQLPVLEPAASGSLNMAALHANTTSSMGNTVEPSYVAMPETTHTHTIGNDGPSFTVKTRDAGLKKKKAGARKPNAFCQCFGF